VRGAAPAASAHSARGRGHGAEYGHVLANSAAQYNGLTGGNTGLAPETALTSSIGIGFTPSFVPNFRAQFDYYDIKIENVIETIGANTIITECVNADLFCNDVHRNAIGSLWIGNTGYIIDSLANVGQLHERGIDADVSYALDVGAAGKVRLNMVGTYLDLYDVTPIEALSAKTSYNCAVCTDLPAAARRKAREPRCSLAPYLPGHLGDAVAGTRRVVRVALLLGVKLEQLSANPNLAGEVAAVRRLPTVEYPTPMRTSPPTTTSTSRPR